MSPSQDPLDPDNATALSTPALAVHLLTYISTRSRQTPFVGRRNFINSQRQSRWGENTHYVGRLGKQTADPKVDKDTYSHAISAAFDWLYVEGLITRHWNPGESGRNDEWFTDTEEGRRFLKRGDDALEAHRAEKLLGFRLHPTIDKRVRQQFLIGETEAAVMIAMKEVEIRIRDTSGLSDKDGQELAGDAFKSAKNDRDPGPLADAESQVNEQEGVAALFRGAMATFRNPVAHRRVDYDDPVEAVEVILFADLLLRMIDRAAAANA